MTKWFLMLLIGFLLNSCVTLINEPTVKVKIYSDIDNLKISVNNDTLNWHTLPASIEVERSKKNLLITAKKDSVQQAIHVESKSSFNFLMNWETLGIGYIIDWKNPKRYTYPKTIFVDLEHDKPYTTSVSKTWLKPEKNLLNFKISIPEGNHLYLNKGYGYGNTFGFLGISTGFEYYFSNKYCINMDVGGLMDFMAPVPAPVDHWGNYNQSYATYGDIQIGSDYKRLHYDVGLQFTRTSFYERETVELFPDYIDTLRYSKSQNNMGLALSTYYRITKGFNIGLNYYPSFIVIGNGDTKFHYSHLIFLELSFKIKAYRPKKRND